VVTVFGKLRQLITQRPITACTHLSTTSITDFQHASLSPLFKSSVCRGWVMQVEFAGEAGRLTPFNKLSPSYGISLIWVGIFQNAGFGQRVVPPPLTFSPEAVDKSSSGQ
jgi:hypothetical protein